MDYIKNILTICGIICGIGLLLYFLIIIGLVISTSAKCKTLGYRTSTLGFPLTRYCKTLLNQTDIIIPLQEALNKKVCDVNYAEN